MFSSFFITKKGQEYLAQLGAGKRLVFTHGQFGDGVLDASADQTDRTALVHPLGNMPIEKQHVSANTVTTTVQFSNRVDGVVLAAFSFMEVGLFAKLKNADGTDDTNSPEALVCYSNALTSEQADYIPNVLTEFKLNFPCIVSNAQNVGAVIDSSLAYVSQKEFEERTGAIPGFSMVDLGNVGSFNTVEEALEVISYQGRDIGFYYYEWYKNNASRRVEGYMFVYGHDAPTGSYHTQLVFDGLDRKLLKRDVVLDDSTMLYRSPFTEIGDIADGSVSKDKLAEDVVAILNNVEPDGVLIEQPEIEDHTDDEGPYMIHDVNLSIEFYEGTLYTIQTDIDVVEGHEFAIVSHLHGRYSTESGNWTKGTRITFELVNDTGDDFSGTINIISVTPPEEVVAKMADINKLIPQYIPYTISASGWHGSSAPYIYTITGYDGKAVNVYEDGALATAEQLEALAAANIKGSPTSEANILYAFGEKPTIDIPVALGVC